MRAISINNKKNRINSIKTITCKNYTNAVRYANVSIEQYSDPKIFRILGITSEMESIKFTEKKEIKCSPEYVFDYTQDYKQRLTWDTFFKKGRPN